MSRQTRINLYSVFIAILLFALGIMYAQVLNQTLEVQGEAEAKAQQGIFITEVEYYADNGADTANSKANFFTSTTLNSTVTLGANAGSTYTYKVTMYNGTDREQVFIGAITNKSQTSQYSNTNIEYDVNSVTGLNGLQEHVTTIAPGDYLTFPVTFKYTGSDVSNRTLTSYINFRFREKPVLELSNDGETYTLENITAGHVEEYEFTVSNYNKDYTNGIPMTYRFETTLTEGSPLEAKIYDENGAEVTGNISELENGTPVDHTYTLKLTWDESKNGAEYRGKEYTCNVKLKAVPNDTDYGEYKIEKEFNIDITTEANNPPTVTVEVSDITSTTAKITAIGEDEDGNTLTYTLEINGQTYTSDTGIFEVTGLGAGKTYTYTVSVTDGYETVTVEKTLTTECINYIVEYIESTGIQYIDTGFFPNENSKMILEFQPTVLQSTVFAGCRANSTTRAFTINSGGGATKQYANFGNTGNYNLGEHNTNKHTVSIENGKFIYDGNVFNPAEVSAFNSSYSVYLFACNSNGATLQSQVRIYSCQIYDNGVLVRDLIPSLDDNNVACMYDKVTKQYFYNSGTGTFNYEMKQVGHIWGEWEITKPATCIEEGIETRTCTVCGEKQTQSIAANREHTYVNGICSICGADTVLAGQKTTITLKYTDGTDTAVIPAGFTVSGASSENIIDNGLVIYLIQDKTDAEIANIDWNDATTLANLKKTYDQFVWIPMPKENINDMYMCQSEDGTKSCQITVQEVDGENVAYCTTHSSTAMAGRLYTTSTGENYTPTLTNQTYKANSGLREPAVITGASSGNGGSFDGSNRHAGRIKRYIRNKL